MYTIGSSTILENASFSSIWLNDYFCGSSFSILSTGLPMRYSSALFWLSWALLSMYIQSSLYKVDSGIIPASTYYLFNSSMCFSSFNFLIRSYISLAVSSFYYSAFHTYAILVIFSGCHCFLLRYDNPIFLIYKCLKNKLSTKLFIFILSIE